MRGGVSRKTNTGTELVNALCEYLSRRGIFHWRNNTGAFRHEHGGFYRFGAPGSPDIITIGNGGKFIGIESKAGSGRLSPDQKRFKEATEKAGGIYIVARSIDDLVTAGI